MVKEKIILFIGTGHDFDMVYRRWNVPGIELRCFNGLNAESIRFAGYVEDLSSSLINHYDSKKAVEVLRNRIIKGTN